MLTLNQCLDLGSDRHFWNKNGMKSTPKCATAVDRIHKFSENTPLEKEDTTLQTLSHFLLTALTTELSSNFGN